MRSDTPATMDVVVGSKWVSQPKLDPKLPQPMKGLF